MRPFYFIISFWGAEFREHFLRLSAASVLSGGNIPSLSNRSDSQFLICTTADDWAAIQHDPTFHLLASQIEPVFIELRRPAPDFLKPILEEKHRRDDFSSRLDQRAEKFSITPTDVLTGSAYQELAQIGREIGHPLTVHHQYALRILFMSNGHKAGASRAFKDNANAVFLAPDLVLSDGTIVELERLVRAGHKVVLTAGLRFCQDECVAALKADGLLVPGKPMALSPRYMVATMFAHMHPETACFEFESEYFCDTATSALWRVSGDDGVVLHHLNFYPLLVNYSGMTRHHAEYFDIGGTIDGKYIALHFDAESDITLVTDSDRLMLGSFTRRSECFYPVTRSWRKASSWFGAAYKTRLIANTLYSPISDPVKRRFYPVPVRFHSRPISPAWKEVERRASTIVGRAMKEPGRLAVIWIRLSRFLSQQSVRSLSWFLVTYPVSKLSPQRRDRFRRLMGKIKLAA